MRKHNILAHAGETRLFDWIAVFATIMITVLYACPAYIFSSTPNFTGFSNLSVWDQMAYTAISISLKESVYPLIEPLTGRYAGFYPPLYYLILAGISLITGISAPDIWNYLMRVIIPPIFFVAMYIFAKKIFNPAIGLVAALICSLAGTWLFPYSYSVVFWPPFIRLFMPAAESFSMIIAVLCFYFTIKLLSDHKNLKYLIIASALEAVVIASHAFVAIFLVGTQAAFMYLDIIKEKSRGRIRPTTIAVMLAPVVLWLFLMALSYPDPIPLKWMAAVGAASFALLYLYSDSASNTRVVAHVIVLSVVLSSFYWVQVIPQLLSGEGAGFYEATEAKGSFLFVPLIPYIENVFIFLLAAVIGLYALYRQKFEYTSYFASMLVSGLALSNNQWFLINYQPFRFIPYSFIPMSLLGANGLYYLWGRKGKLKILGAAIGLIILLSSAFNFGFIGLYGLQRSKSIFLSTDISNGIAWLKGNTNPSDVVASSSMILALEIRIYSGRRGIIPYSAFAGKQLAGGEAAAHLLILKDTDPAIRDWIINKYGIQYVVVEPQDVKDFGDSLYNFKSDGRFSLAYQSNNLSIFKVLLNPVEGGEPPLSERELVGYWNFSENGGSIAHDKSGLGNDGSINGATWYRDQYMGGLSFSSTPGRQMINFTNSSSLNINGKSNVTLIVWYKANKVQQYYGGLIGKGDLNSYKQYGVWIQGNEVHFTFNGTDSTCNASVSDGLWHQIAVVYNHANASCYVDSVNTMNISETDDIPNTTYPVLTGNGNPGLDGVVGNIMIYNRALSQDEIEFYASWKIL